MITDQAFVLHKRAFKDSSELIKLMTLNHGIVDVLAKGSQRPKSKLKGQLQPFTLTWVNWVGKSSLKTLVDAEQSAVLQRCKYINHVSMLYCNELLVILKPEEDMAKIIFSGYVETIKRLAVDITVNETLRQFEWLLCCSAGYQLTLPVAIEETDFIKFDYENGLVIDKQKQFCQALSFSQFIEQRPLNSVQLKQVGRLMKVVVNHLVGGKVIQSRQLLHKTFDSQSHL